MVRELGHIPHMQARSQRHLQVRVLEDPQPQVDLLTLQQLLDEWRCGEHERAR